jgi:hypothetical protein
LRIEDIEKIEDRRSRIASPVRSSILDLLSAICQLRLLPFGLALPLAGADLAPLPFVALPPGAAEGLPVGNFTLAGPVGGAGAFKLLASAGFAGIGTELTVGSFA